MADGAVIGNLTIPVIKGDKGDKGNTGEIISISLVLLSPSSTAYAVNNGSTTQAQIELGIPKGLSVSTTNINASGELVFTFNDNSTVNVGQVVGKGISEVTVTDDFDFVVTYTDGTSVTACNLEEEILGAINDILESYYTKTEIDEMGFITKEVNNLTNYYKKDETYTKQEVDNKVASVYKYKGTVASYNNLPSTGLTIGDVYNVEDTGDNYAWTGTDWDKLGGDIDLSGYQEKIDNSHKLNADLVDDSNSINKFTSATEKNSWNAKYNKPSGGIPKSDLSNEVQASLGKADTAVQDVSGKEDSSNKTGVLNSSSTTAQYPHAKAVYDELIERDEEINQLWNDHPDILDNNALPSGTDLTLQDTGDLKMKVDVGGNSTQVQYEGKNKLNASADTYSFEANTVDTKTIGTLYLEANTKYYISYNVDNSSSSNERNTPSIKATGINTVYQYAQTNYNLTKGRKVWEFIPTVSSNYTLAYWCHTPNIDISVSDFMVSTSSDITFEPYTNNLPVPSPNQKSDINNVEGDVEVKGSNKNLANLDNIQIGKSWTGGNNSSRACLYIDVKPDSDYTISLYGIENMEEIGLIEKANAEATSVTTPIIQISTIPFSKTTSSNTNVIVIQFIKTNISLEDFQNIRVQLEEGSTATSYVPFGENSVTFPLSQGQKLMLGDTLEDDGIHHKRGKYVFTGTETLSANIANQKAVFYGSFLNDKDQSTAVQSNSYKSSTSAWTTIDNNFITIQNNSTFIFIRDDAHLKEDEFVSLRSFKTYLAEQYANGTPVILEYELATETITPYTQAQQTAYNKLKEMQSYYNLTYVVGSSDNAQPILTVQAKKSLKVINDEISNINSRLTLLEE